jgi:plasmid stabilization system protein ParE
MISATRVALEALVSNAEYIAAERPQKGVQFVDSVENLLQLIESSPGMGKRYDSADVRLTSLRWTIVPGFSEMLLFYKEVDNGIEFVHLIHGRRDLGEVLAAEFGLK